jgi:hypothetical protein
MPLGVYRPVTDRYLYMPRPRLCAAESPFNLPLAPSQDISLGIQMISGIARLRAGEERRRSWKSNLTPGVPSATPSKPALFEGLFRTNRFGGLTKRSLFPHHTVYPEHTLITQKEVGLRAREIMDFPVDQGFCLSNSTSLSRGIWKRRSRHRKLFSKCATLDKGQSAVLAVVDVTGWDEESSTDAGGRFVFHPNRGFKVKWDSLFVFLVLYTAIMVPYQIGFDVSVTGGLYVFDAIVDVVYILDLIFSFLTAYMDKRGKPVWDTRKIARHYLKGGGMIDLVASIPMDKIADGLNFSEPNLLRSPKLLRIARITRAFKLLRLLDFSSAIRGIQEAFDQQLQVHNFFSSMIRMALPVIFLGHILACVFHWLLILQRQTSNDWLARRYTDVSHISRGLAYTNSMYWAFTTTTTVGYGDIRPINDAEHIIAMIAMIIGGSTFGYIVGNVTVIMEGMNAQSRSFRRRLDSIDGYIRERSLPSALSDRIRKHATFMLRKLPSFESENIFQSLPGTVDAQLTFVHYGEVIAKIPFLHKQPIMFVAFIAKLLKPMLILKKDVLFFENELGTALYFLVSGSIECIMSASKRRVKYEVISSGQHLGEVRRQ